ncbi:5-formyltetrahydrofolate cyclo-ligase [Paenibacillus oenotherae]|nr:5-formyltetrahydrofolate cyclo-ligase [Paenibacillus oenotherae]
MMEPTDRKRAARAMAMELRGSIAEELREERSRAACEGAKQWLGQAWPGCSSMMLYMPFRSELDVRPLIEWGWRSGIAVIVPRCLPEQRFMELYRIHSWNDVHAGAYGIMEPDPSRVPRCGEQFMPDVVFVPGLAFDRQGGRLGYGGGYYDRFYDRLHGLSMKLERSMPLWIGCGYEAQLVAEVPMEEHDARLGAIMTEQGISLTGNARTNPQA